MPPAGEPEEAALEEEAGRGRSMRERLACVIVCVLLVGADNPPAAGLAEARQEIPEGSEWEVVRGRYGIYPVTKGEVIFHVEGLIDIEWSWDTGPALGERRFLYQSSKRQWATCSKGHLSLHDTQGLVRVVEGRLEVYFRHETHGGKPCDLHLTLKRGRR
jgi:hypothetical protein